MKMATKTKEVGNLVQMPAHERRGTVRYPFTAAADVVELETDARLSARSSDLGRGGCFIDTISTFPVGTDVSLRLTSEEKTFETRAHVVYETPGVGMGLAFTSVEPDQLWVLEKWLGRLSGQLPPELHEHHEHAEEGSGMLIEHEPAQEARANAEPGFVLNELIIALMRKHVLSESEGKQLLQKLVR
ncbi:MAG: PilZ domain-containing protein [Candidatus Acidiferrales bacterium]